MTADTMLSRVPSSVPQVLHDGLGELHEVPRRVQQPLARLRLHHLHQPVSLLYTIQIFSLYSNSLKSWGCLKSSGTSEYLTRPTGLTAARPTPSPRQPPWSAATGAQEPPTWLPCLCLLSSKSSKSALNIVEIILWHIYSKYVFIWKVLREKVLRGSRLLREHGGPQHHLLWVVRVRVNIWVMCLYIFQLGRFRSSCKWTSIHREDFHSRSTIKGSSWTISRFHVEIVISYNK